MLEDTLGVEWRAHFDEFDMVPFAAASIGQVHAAVLAPTSPYASMYPRAMPLAVKVQFPGVRASISSDLANLRWLLVAGAVLPKGLYLENTLKVMERELDDECDYGREADCGARMRELVATGSLAGEFDCPRVVKELSGDMVLTTEMMSGEALGNAIHYDQATRDDVRPSCSRERAAADQLEDPQIGSKILKLCLTELFQFRFMQTDPNWSNFLFNTTTRKVRRIPGPSPPFEKLKQTLDSRLNLSISERPEPTRSRLSTSSSASCWQRSRMTSPSACDSRAHLDT